MRGVHKLVAVATLACIAALPAALAAGEAGSTHEVKATVVSVDAEGKTITFKDSNGTEKTAPVLESAVSALGDLEPGDAVVLTCTDDEEGNHKGVSSVKPANS